MGGTFPSQAQLLGKFKNNGISQDHLKSECQNNRLSHLKHMDTFLKNPNNG